MHPEILPSLAGLTGVGPDEAEAPGFEVARVPDYASRHLVRPAPTLGLVPLVSFQKSKVVCDRSKTVILSNN